MNRRHHSRLILLTACLAGIQPATLRAATIIDEKFNTSSTFSVTYIQPSGTNFSYADGERSFGDNTLQVMHVHDSERDDDNFPIETGMLDLQSLVRITNVTYTPTVSGIIQTLAFKIDFKTNDPFAEVFFFIERLGFGVLGGLTPIHGDNDGTWKTLELVGLTDADFLGEGFFSSSAPLGFGFGFVSSASLDPFSEDPVTYEIEADNFQVTVTPIPEPGPAVLMLGAGALLLRRKRQTAM